MSILSLRQSATSDFSNDDLELDESKPEQSPGKLASANSIDIARQETQAVRVLRFVVLFLLIGAAIAVSVAAYVYLQRDEQDALEENFHDLGNRLMDGFHANALLRLHTMDSFATTLTATAQVMNQTWPFVTTPHFESLATAARFVVGGAVSLGVYPYVTNETRQEWEAYALQNTTWLNESYAYQQEFKDFHGRTIGEKAPDLDRRRRLGTTITVIENMNEIEDTDEDLNAGETMDEDEPTDDDEEPMPSDTEQPTTTTSTSHQPSFRPAVFDGPDGISPEIYRYGTEEEGELFVVDESPGPYYLMWQVSPAREFAAIDVNYNYNDPFYAGGYATAFEELRTSQSAIFAGVWNVDEVGYIDENDDFDFRVVPVAAMLYPIFDQVDHFQDRKVVAVIDLDVEFGPLFSSVLPSGSSPLLCVVRNPCSQVFSYKVTGETATYLGPEDLHNTKYDTMMVEALLTDFYQDESKDRLDYNGAPVNKDFCPWVLNVYATQEMEDAHLTSKPVYYMCAILGIFLFTCTVFVLYDRIVESRQRKVMSTANISHNIVSSLFPKAVQDQLYGQQQQEQQQDKSKDTTKIADGVQNFLRKENNGSNGNTNNNATVTENSPPIAELYRDCTVFFADVAGACSLHEMLLVA